MTIVRQNRRVAWKRVDAEVLLLASDSNTLTVLNDTGGRVWELADGGCAVSDIVASIVREFAVDHPQAAADVDAVISQLVGRGLLVEGEP